MNIDKRKCTKIDTVLQVNRPVQIVAAQGNRRLVYRSSVADFDSANVYLTPATRDSFQATFRIGDAVDIIYSGVDALYEFSSIVVGHKKDNRVDLITVEKPHACMRVQRRNFFRLDFGLDATFRRIEIEDRKSKKVFVARGTAFPCLIDDVSGGGLAFTTREELDDASYVAIEFHLPDDDDSETPLKQVVKIIRTKKIKPLLSEKDVNEYTYGGNFAAIDDDTQTRLIRFIIRKQIEYRKSQKTTGRQHS